MTAKKIIRSSQPQGATNARTDGLGRGLRLLSTPSLGNANAVSGGAGLVSVGTPTRSVGPAGVCWSNLTTSNYLTWVPPVGLTEGTVLFLGQISAISTDHAWGQYGSGTVGQYDWAPLGSDNTLRLGAWATTRVNNGDAVPGGVSTLLQPHTIIGVGSTAGSYHQNWVNGLPVSVPVTTKTFGYASTMRIGSTAVGGYPGKIYLVAVWDRALTDAEIAEVSRNPWQLFAPINQRAPTFTGLSSSFASTTEEKHNLQVGTTTRAKRPRTSQPQGAAQANPEWVRGLGRIYLPHAPRIGDGYDVQGSAGDISAGSLGLRQSFSSNDLRSRLNIPENTTRIVLAVASTNSTAAGERYTNNFSSFSSGNYLCRVGQNGTTLKGQFRSFGGSAVNLDAPGTAVVGRPFVFLLRVGNDGLCHFWLDGKLIALGSVGALSSTLTGWEGVGTGRSHDGIQPWDGHIYLAANLTGGYSVEEAGFLAANPWQLFAPVRSPIFAKAAPLPLVEEVVAEPGGPVAGTLSTTETGTDAFVASGAVAVVGSLSVSETGADTFVGSGTVGSVVTGSLSVTETGADTFAGSGAVVVTGPVAATESGTDTFVGSGTVVVAGLLNATETGTDTFLASGGNTVTGSLSATETGSDASVITGKVFVAGSLAATESSGDTTSIAGTVAVAGSLSATETGADSFVGSGVVGTVSIGALNATETGTDSFSSTGNVVVAGGLSVIEVGTDSLTSTGTVKVTGSAVASETDTDFAEFLGKVLVQGSFVATEQAASDLFAANGAVYFLSDTPSVYLMYSSLGPEAMRVPPLDNTLLVTVDPTSMLVT